MPDKRFANKRSPIQRERDELTIAELNLKGWTQRAIADHLELSVSMVNATLKKIKNQWAKQKLEDTDLAMKQELKRLSMLEAEYWKAWERSQGDQEVTLSERLASAGKGGQDGSIGRLKTATRIERKVGDVQFLNGINKVIESRCKIRGLNAPLELKVQEVAEAMINNQINMIFEAIVSNPAFTEEQRREFFETIAKVQGQAAVAGEN